MTDNKLIEILNNSFSKQYEKSGLITAYYTAQDLLANGVIVPPCKVGDTVYVINEFEVEETSVFSTKIETEDSRWVIFLKARVADHGIKFKDGYGSVFKTFIFGKTVFLTKEEAEQALKEREK